jgi:hypothetical protein
MEAVIISCPQPMSDVFVVDGEQSVIIHPMHGASCLWVQKVKTTNSPANIYWKYNGAVMTDSKQGFIMPEAPDILHLHYNSNDEFYFHFWVDNGCQLTYQFFRPSIFG